MEERQQQLHLFGITDKFSKSAGPGQEKPAPAPRFTAETEQ
jgi:hypothetical protein